MEDYFLCTEVVDVLLQNVQFALDEPVTLVFLPWVTHSDSTVTTGSAGDKEKKEEGNGRTGDEVCYGSIAYGPDLDEWSVRYMRLLGMDGSEQSDVFETDVTRRKKAIEMLTFETEELHCEVSTIVAEFSSCTHVPNPSSPFPCAR